MKKLGKNKPEHLLTLGYLFWMLITFGIYSFTTRKIDFVELMFRATAGGFYYSVTTRYSGKLSNLVWELSEKTN